MKRFLITTFCLLLPMSTTWAGNVTDSALHSISQTTSLPQTNILWVASTAESIDTPENPQKNNAVFTSKTYKTPLFSANKLHKYLGIGAVIFGGVTALAAPDGDNEGLPPNTPASPVDDGFHQAMALTATTMAVLATATGFLFHFDDLSLSNGVTDPDNMHMALGLLGTIGYASAISLAPDNGGEGESHATAGILGGASMLIAIKLEW